MPRRRRTNHRLWVSEAEMPTAKPPPLDGVDESMVENVNGVQQLLDYDFRNPKLLQEALTHRSYPDCTSFERLEHLGDAALNLAFTNHFFTAYPEPEVGPGLLSIVRAANISNAKFARIAVQNELYGFTRRHNTPTLDNNVAVFSNAVMGETKKEFGGSTIKAPKVLADIVESIAGAVYFDCNFDLKILREVIWRLLEPNIVTFGTLAEQLLTALDKFYEKHGETFRFWCWKCGRSYVTKIFVDGELLGVGSSEREEISKLIAAREVLLRLPESELEEMKKELLAVGFSERKQISKILEAFLKLSGSKPEEMSRDSSFDKELSGVGSSEQKQISELNAGREALLNLSESESEEMSTDSSFNEVEEKEEAKHQLGILKKHWQNSVHKFLRAVAVGIEFVAFVLWVMIVLRGLIFLSCCNPPCIY